MKCQCVEETHCLRNDLSKDDDHRRGHDNGIEPSAENIVQEDGKRLVDNLGRIRTVLAVGSHGKRRRPTGEGGKGFGWFEERQVWSGLRRMDEGRYRGGEGAWGGGAGG